ncbi:MAG: amidohydrolase, partial [Planctomycetaceae bacterium]
MREWFPVLFTVARPSGTGCLPPCSRTSRRSLVGLVVVAGWLSWPWVSPSARAEEPPTLVVHSGKIVTVDPQFRVVEAFAVRGERLVAVGANADIRPLAGPNTRQLDLGGATVLPGLIDSHVHPIGAALHEFAHPIPQLETIADVLAYVSSRAAALPEGQWIALRQVFITRLRDQRYPTRAELDQAAPRHPVLFATGPDAALNSLALERSGLTRDSQVTDGGPGQIEKDPQTGELTGILRSCGRLVKFTGSDPGPTPAQERERLRLLLDDYLSVGLTGISCKNSGDGEVALFRALHLDNQLPLRVYLHAAVDAQAPLEEIDRRLQRLAADPAHAYNNRLWLRGIKCFLDGGMLTGSAYMRAPWGVSRVYSISDPAYRGLRFIEQEKLEEIVRLAVRHNFQMTAHSVGDAACEALADAYATVNAELGQLAPPPVLVPATAGRGSPPGFTQSAAALAAHRPSLTHANFLTPQAIGQMRSLGIVCDLQPAWLWLDTHTLRAQFGEDRLRVFQPYRQLFDAGVAVGGGSDHMQRIGSLSSVNPYNPFLGMSIAVRRLPRQGGPALHPGERLTRAEAIRLYTLNNAWLTFEEHEKGSLEPGKLADFIILDRDLLTCPEEELAE